MARETRTVVIDDVDGSEADETFTFDFDGQSYEIDLTTKHADQLERAFQLLDPFVDHIRRVASPSRGSSPATRRRKAPVKRVVKRVTPGYDARAVRAWAWENGIELGNRGRIAANIVEKWRASLSR
jgi:hypothetical protein